MCRRGEVIVFLYIFFLNTIFSPVHVINSLILPPYPSMPLRTIFLFGVEAIEEPVDRSLIVLLEGLCVVVF
jgi:hypothetical protein